jgi:DNA-binding response OmpR family regulator
MAKNSRNCVRILAVTSNASNWHRLCKSLHDSWPRTFQVERAECLAEAIQLSVKLPFDAAVLDLNLPDSRGLETCMKMRRAMPDTATIILAGTDEEPIVFEAIQQGIRDYLAHGGALGRAVHRAVEHRRARRTPQDAEERLRAKCEELTVASEELQAQSEEVQVTHEELREQGQALADSLEAQRRTAERLNLLSDTAANLLAADRGRAHPRQRR